MIITLNDKKFDISDANLIKLNTILADVSTVNFVAKYMDGSYRIIPAAKQDKLQIAAVVTTEWNYDSEE
jgi:hypothetical protein